VRIKAWLEEDQVWDSTCWSCLPNQCQSRVDLLAWRWDYVCPVSQLWHSTTADIADWRSPCSNKQVRLRPEWTLALYWAGKNDVIPLGLGIVEQTQWFLKVT
jgi:hypothetical protein